MGKKDPIKKGRGKRYNPFQAVRNRPDWAIGSPITIRDDKWIWSDDNKMMILKNITFNNGLFIIIREIGSNAIDNKWRTEEALAEDPDSPAMKKIEFKVDVETGEISIYNDGYQIPVEQQEFDYTDHRTNETSTEVMYPAEIYFGDMFSGTNYDDMDEEEFVKEISSSKKGRKTSGRNGMGAKAANIFSVEFTVDHTDTVNKKRFLQTYRDCGQTREKPVVTSYRNKTGYTRITFTPDYKYFKFPDKDKPRMTKNFYSYLRAYAYEMAMVTGLPVTFNDEKIVVKSLEKYARLFYSSAADNKMVHITTPLGDEAVLVEGNELETESMDAVTHTSFINGIHTSRGGKYVNLFRDAIFTNLVRTFNSRKKKVQGKNLKTTAKKLYPYFHLFIRCEAVEPPFDSQTKDHCILEKFDFYSPKSQKEKTEWGKTLESATVKILKWKFVGLLEDKLISELDRANIKKETSSKKRLVIGKKLTEANLQRKKPLECIICFTEGDSAKTLVTRGSNNPDYIGSLALRGKILNVSKHSKTVVNSNKILLDIKKVIGLRTGLDYTRQEYYSTLRYGKSWLMMDRDSVTGDTPLLLRKNDLLEIKTIESLNSEWKPSGAGKEYGDSSYEVWTERGWTVISQIMRHKVKKRIFRVLTHTGYVDVTEDHSLLTPRCEKISPKKTNVGDELLHSFPTFAMEDYLTEDQLKGLYLKDLQKLASDHGIQHQTYKKEDLLNELRTKIPRFIISEHPSDIPPDEAFAMGLFWADGACGIYDWKQTKNPEDGPNEYIFNKVSVSWSISNTDIDLLKRVKNVMETCYNYKFVIDPDRTNCDRGDRKHLYKLQLRGGPEVSSLVEKYRELFYTKNQKSVPPCILNAPEEIRRQFYEGVQAGDGYRAGIEKENNFNAISISGKIGAQGIYCLTKSLGYKVSINCRKDNPDIISLCVTEGRQQKDPTAIKKIIDLGVIKDYVYDLETDNHHFQAGVGQMIVHNTDGFHIQGLLLNFFYREFPSLLQRGFVSGFNTAVVQLWYKTPKEKQLGTKRFYTNAEYQAWCKTDECEEMAKYIKGTKYYKGLGTIEPKDAPIYFKDPKLIDFKYNGKREKTMDLGFGDGDEDKKDRKEWIKDRLKQESDGHTFGDIKYEGSLTLEEFVDYQLILYHKESIRRSIPCIYDGLKDCQRKALYSVFKRKYSKQNLFVIVSGNVIADSAYHHGDKALKEAMIKMGQGFVGSNNIPYFENAGEYGSRMLGTSDEKTHAADRYLFFKMEEIMKTIFPEDDFPLYKQIEEEGNFLEYEYFMPILPMLLVNGAEGIACGFSTSIASYNPSDLVRWIRTWLQDRDEDTNEVEKLDPLVPWYNGFEGNIYLKTEKGNAKWVSEGILEEGAGKKVIHQGSQVMKSDAGWWHIRELPIGLWTTDFKEHLDYLEFGSVEGKKKKLEVKCLSEVKDYNRANRVHFMIKPTKDFIPDMDTKDNMDCLRQTKGLTNVVAIDENNIPYHYKSPEEILEKYAERRIDFYWKRKKHFLGVYKHNLKVANNKYIYVKAVVDRELDMYQDPRPLEADMKALGLKKIGDEGKESYDYLLNMAMRSMTPKRLDELKKEQEKWKMIRDELKEKSEEDLWRADLDKFEIAYKKFLKTRVE